MNNRSSSRRYGIQIGEVSLTQIDLDLIRSNANQILLNEQGFDVSRAWVKATLGYLVSKGLLDSDEKLDADEKA